ncbi:VOC family protein [Pedobacter antarcticus]|uniref:VOC family protein n=1 Tax=Pedobacter antarcticus TaxID=34086 RepID=UPI00292CB907|nr:VOC family protein [Pedobacter antarcticus]
MMYIEHLAVWTADLERMKAFYEKYFNATANEKYENNSKRFESYFLSFGKGPRLELMKKSDILGIEKNFENQSMGLVHLAFSVGSPQKVDELTALLECDGYKIAGRPRTTGDGYYESIVLDPENNIIEITE